MLSKIKGCPKVLFQKLIYTVFIGLSFFVFGTAYFFYANDRIMLMLSGIVLVFSLWRAVDIYFIILKRKYEIVEGACVSVTSRPLSKFNRVRFMDKDGIESTVHLRKNVKLKIGFQYRLFFSQREHISTGSVRMDAALASGHFLGFEELGEYGSGENIIEE